MKKFLSLVLALVMTMSLVTISAGAKDFTDGSKITYVEAVDVLSAVKVIDGYTDGSFNPTATLTRGAAAKIICNLILGPTTASALHADAAPFSDVPADSTFAGYITYCAKEGIVGGYADGTFKPGNTLTGYAFMKMLLGALGYDADVEGYNTPGSWSISVAKRALNIGLDKGLVSDFDGVKAVTREEACLYALNTLKADMVEYDTKTSISIGGAEVIIAGSAAKPVEYKDGKYDGNIEGGEDVQQFAEKYFTDLKLSTENGVYGRPSNKWTLKKTEIGTYASVEPTYVYTKKVDSDDLYKEVGKDVLSYNWNAMYVDGAKDAGNNFKPTNTDTTYGNTAKGVLTEIYVNDAEETVTVVYINTYLTQIGKVREDDDGTYVTVDKKGIKENKFYTDDFKADDYVLITVDVNDDGDTYIASLYAPETVEGTVTAVNKKENTEGLDGSYLKLDGEKKEYAADCLGDLDNNDTVPALSTEYKLYLDEFGYVKGFVALENLYDQYLYVIETDWTLGTVKANVLMADGTIQTITVKDELQDGTDLTKDNTVRLIEGYACAYDVDSKDVYTLKPITNDAKNNVTVKDGKAYGTGVSYVIDADTVFSDKKDKVSYTGYEAVPEYTGAKIIIVEDSKTISNVVFVLDWATKSTVDDFYFYVADYKDFETYKTEKKLVQRTVFVDGVKDSKFIMTKDASNTVVANENGLYQVKGRDTDGNVNKVEFIGNVAAFAKDTVSIVGNKSFVSTQTEVSAGKNNTEGTGKWTFDDDTTFVFVEKDKDGKYTKVTTGPAKSIDVYKSGMANTDDVSLVKVVKAKDAKALLVYVVAAKVADLADPAHMQEAADAIENALNVVEAIDVDNINTAAECDTALTNLAAAKTRLTNAIAAGKKVDAATKADVETAIAEIENVEAAVEELKAVLAGGALATAKTNKLAEITALKNRMTADVIALMSSTDAAALTQAVADAQAALDAATTEEEVNAITVTAPAALTDAEDQFAANQLADTVADVTLEGISGTLTATKAAVEAELPEGCTVAGDVVLTAAADRKSASATTVTVTATVNGKTATKDITVTMTYTDVAAVDELAAALGAMTGRYEINLATSVTNAAAATPIVLAELQGDFDTDDAVVSRVAIGTGVTYGTAGNYVTTLTVTVKSATGTYSVAVRNVPALVIVAA